MNISVDGNSDMFVDLSPGTIEYNGPIDLAQYYIRSKSIGSVDMDNMVAIEFSFGRRLLSTFLSTYVPTLLLNIIALSTNYFKVYNESIIIANNFFRTFSLKLLSLST